MRKKLILPFTIASALAISGGCLETVPNTNAKINIATESKVYELGELVQLTFPGGNPSKLPEINDEKNFNPPVFQWDGAKEYGREPLEILHRELEIAKDTKHVILDYVNKLPTQLEMRQLKKAGIFIEDYIKDGAYYASINAQGLEHLMNSGISIFEISPKSKMGPNVNEEMKAMEITLAHDTTSKDIDKIVNKYGLDLKARLEQLNTFTIALNPENANEVINSLIHEDKVRMINAVPPPLEILETFSGEMNIESKKSTGALSVQELWGFEGEGIRVYIHDAGTIGPHLDLDERVTILDASPWGDHPTHVAGIIGGDGTRTLEWGRKDNCVESIQCPNGLLCEEGTEEEYCLNDKDFRGMAPKVLFFSDAHNHCDPYCLYETPAQIDEELRIAIADHDVIITNNSIGTNARRNGFGDGVLGVYETTCQIVDGMALGYQGKKVITLFAAGNERHYPGPEYDTLGQPASAKNPIVVGAVNHDGTISDFTSFGPTDDGRIGVTVVAPGVDIISTVPPSPWGTWDSIYYAMSGTSMATPDVTGNAVLIYEAFLSTFGENAQMLPSSMKAILIQTARDVANPGPDFQSGFGMIRATKAIEQVENRQFLEQVIHKSGEVHKYKMLIAPREDEARFSLAWDDIPGPKSLKDGPVHQALVNDLDLVVRGPDGTTYRPLILNPNNPEAIATPGSDRLNNIEQITVQNPESGIWEVYVSGFKVPQGPQTYSLAFDEATERRGGSFIENTGNDYKLFKVKVGVEQKLCAATELCWQKYSDFFNTSVILQPGERIELRDLAKGRLNIDETGDYRLKLEVHQEGYSSLKATSEFFVR